MAARRHGALRVGAVLWKASCYALGALVVAFLVAQLWFFAHILLWTRVDPSSSAFISARLEELRRRDPSARIERRWVPYERVSVHLKRAVVAAEDAKFLDHEGFDWQAIQKALERNEKRGRIVGGASTISQQLAKNMFLSGERSWLRKGQEAMITWMMERILSKRRILELYLNFAEWGDGIFGAEAAARHHFGVPASALSREQAAWLAVILPSPRRYVLGRTTPYLATRVAIISERMSAAHIP